MRSKGRHAIKEFVESIKEKKICVTSGRNGYWIEENTHEKNKISLVIFTLRAVFIL